MPSISGIEAGLAICRAKGISWPPGILAAQISVKVTPENSADAVKGHRIHAGIQETGTKWDLRNNQT